MNERHQPRGDAAPRSSDFRRAIERLERAISELEGSTRERLSDRATRALDDVADRLEREADRRGRRRSHRHRRRAWGYRNGASGRRAETCEDFEAPDPSGSARRRLRLDPERARIGGVCAGVARYHGMEPWVARCIAVTAALFFPSIVIPAYLIAWFVLDSPARARRRNARRTRAEPADQHAASAPEVGARLSPRHSLKHLQGTLGDVEQRLRRIETHVTSGQYELQRELNKIARSV